MTYFFDTIWGEIEVTPLAREFIDVFEFQRMRFMKQLGVCNFVFTTAESSRFAHSIGVYHLARTLVLSLAAKSPHLVTEDDINLIPIAALYHDIGHGPFSHLFDKITGTDHEERSKQIIDYVTNIRAFNLSHLKIEFIKECISPSDANKRTWRFQIVSNDVVDVDRIDYILRDSYATGVATTFNTTSAMRLIRRAYIDEGTGALVYPTTELAQDLLDARAFMHERVYRHRITEKIERIMGEAMKDKFDALARGPIEDFLAATDSILQDTYLSRETPMDVRVALGAIFSRDF